MTNVSLITKGIIKENPVFVLLLGMCPTLAVTGSGINGFAMGAATMFVLILSNIVISGIKSTIPSKVRIPAYIVVIATFVTIVQLLMEAYTPSLHKQLGLFIPLIVVNCLILGRAEAFASKNNMFHSFLDGLGMGLGLTILGLVRELLGAGTLFGINITGMQHPKMMLVFILPPGAFIVLAYLVSLNRMVQKNK
ncbi:MAG TPA: electron transport complex subunit RsxE [Bacteroidales bacterium]|mgnify:CR=1 FL=1|nr:electron transport complex subunit RsxE [Bacteroidales bacterium]